jgi:hypothetical protein
MHALPQQCLGLSSKSVFLVTYLVAPSTSASNAYTKKFCSWLCVAFPASRFGSRCAVNSGTYHCIWKAKKWHEHVVTATSRLERNSPFLIGLSSDYQVTSFDTSSGLRRWGAPQLQIQIWDVWLRWYVWENFIFTGMWGQLPHSMRNLWSIICRKLEIQHIWQRSKVQKCGVGGPNFCDDDQCALNLVWRGSEVYKYIENGRCLIAASVGHKCGRRVWKLLHTNSTRESPHQYAANIRN